MYRQGKITNPLACPTVGSVEAELRSCWAAPSLAKHLISSFPVSFPNLLSLSMARPSFLTTTAPSSVTNILSNPPSYEQYSLLPISSFGRSFVLPILPHLTFSPNISLSRIPRYSRSCKPAFLSKLIVVSISISLADICVWPRQGNKQCKKAVNRNS